MLGKRLMERPAHELRLSLQRWHLLCWVERESSKYLQVIGGGEMSNQK